MLRSDAEAFYRRHRRPFVTLSYAQSLDGSIATAAGQPLRISSPQSMIMTHALRAAHDAILVGINTVLADDPSLTVRLDEGNNPQPIVLDSQLRMPQMLACWRNPEASGLATRQYGVATAEKPLSAERHAQMIGICRLPATDRVTLRLS